MVTIDLERKTLFVAGYFDEGFGKPSKIAEQVFEAVNPINARHINGGCFNELFRVLENIEDYDLIFWFADVPNNKPKIVEKIKKKHKACVLVTSKRNRGEYSFHDLLYHALGVKSNLFVEISENENNRYQGRVIDPLGNVFLDYNEDFGLVGKVIGKRADEMMRYTRVSSEREGDRIRAPKQEEFKEFIGVIRGYADLFHELVHSHPKATNRFFGNASFRKGDLIFVTRRNVDKRDLDRDSFVAVKPENPICYFGDNKPSIDTPTQVKLYNFYSDVKFMLHSHAYIQDAPFTSRIIPCGALEEADEIIRMLPYEKKNNFFVNIRGHGSLALVDRVEYLKSLPYFTRELPEVVK